MKTSLRAFIIIKVLVLLSFQLKAQTVTDPSRLDATYDTRKLQAIRPQPARGNIPVTKAAKTARNAVVNDCFIPVDNSFTAIPRNDDGSFGPIALPFTFDLYGNTYTQLWINTNGNLTFTRAYSEYNASGFPTNEPMVAGFWADIDTRAGGEIFYKVDSTHLIVTWNGVGYYNSRTDKLNTFQIILTQGRDPIIGPGQNVAFYYKDMQWTTGSSSGGTNGFGGTPATVGVNKGSDDKFIQVGRFNQNSDVYDGPGGLEDGVNYLDDQCFRFNATSSMNIPPSVSGLPSGNTITLNVGDSATLTPTFIGPEVGQQVVTTVNTRNACKINYTVTNGQVSTVNLKIKADTCNIGTRMITFTATDDGTPVQATDIDFRVVINKLNQTITFPDPGPVTGAYLQLQASSTSLLPVQFQVISGPGTISGDRLYINGMGLITVQAVQPGNNVFNAATSEPVTLCAPLLQPGVISGPVKTCINSVAEYTAPFVRGANYTWLLNGPGQITAIADNKVTVQWADEGTGSLTVYYGANCNVGNPTSKLDVQVVNTRLNGTFTKMLPSDGNSNLVFPISFSWFPISNAVSYDLYIWPESGSRPVTPTISNINAINYTLTGSPFMQYGESYKWQVVARSICDALESQVQTFRLRYLPDLVINNIELPATGFSGQPLSIKWEVRNIGQGATLSQRWRERLYLSKDAVLDDQDIQLGSVENVSELGAGKNYVNTVPFTLPQGINDNYYVFVITDAYDQLLETSQTNNQLISTSRVAVQLTPPPDLQVTSLVPLNNAFSGQDIQVNWRIGNVGTGGTVASGWTDQVYLSKDEQLNIANATRLGTFHHTGALLVNEGYNNTQSTFRLPEGISGRYFIYVLTDVQNEVYEHAQEGNNTRRSDSINIILTPPIDLTVPAVMVLPAASNGEHVNISWRVENAGGSGTDTKRWSDAVYLSRTATFNKDSARLLGSVPRAAALAPGEGYDGKGTFRIPADITGGYYIYVIADADLQVFEYTYESNNTGRSAQRVDILTPDLTVSAVRIPVSDISGQQVTVSWDLHNSGAGRQYGALVTDRIYLSTAATFNAANSTILKEVSYQTGELASGAAAVQETTVKLPNGISGTRYIYVETNYQHQLYESSYANNIKRSTAGIAVTLAPSPDLLPIAVTVGDTATAGDVITLSYRVKNTGVKTVDQQLWTDKLYISTSPVWDSAKSLLLRDLAQTRVVPQDSIYEVSSSVKLPGALGDSLYRIYVFADGNDDVYEHNAEDNNIVRGANPIYVKRYPPIDLAVSAVSAPATGNSGDPIKISWTVGNNSRAATLATQWEDALYLSADTVLDAGDRLVKAHIHRGVLPENGAYTEEQTFVLPNGVSGSYYLLLVADHTDLHRDPNRRNNYLLIRPAGGGTPMPTVIGLTPPPDLVVQRFTAPDEGTAGQPVLVRWTVQNNGTGVTAAGSWTDKVYLSTNLQLDASDIMIGSAVHNGALQPGTGYSDSLQVFLPGGASGNYALILKADANDNVYEHGAEDNTATALSTISKAPLSDLVVTAVEAPAQVAAGEPVTIRWRLKNTGANPASGYLQEGIYFSKDKEKQITDVLLGSSETTVNLPPQAEMERSFTAELKGVSLGDYYTLIHTDILNNISETSDTNNITASLAISSVSVPELPLNVLTARQLAKDKELYYRIEVPDSLAGESLLVVLKGDSLRGNNELYLRHGQVPTRAVHDFAHAKPYQGNQEIIIPELKAGTYYLLLYGSTTAANVQPVTLKAAILPFEIRTVNAESGGNTGAVTIQVNGSKLVTVTTLQLRNAGGTIPASKLSVSDPTSIYATLSLKDALTGVYDVVAENAKGETAVLKDGFTIATGVGTNLVTNVVAPPSTRPTNVISLTVEFTNAGNTDIVNPVLKLTSLGGAPIGFTLQELEQHKQELTLTLQELNGPVGILRPGAKGVITVYAKATTSLGFMLVSANR